MFKDKCEFTANINGMGDTALKANGETVWKMEFTSKDVENITDFHKFFDAKQVRIKIEVIEK